MAEINAWIRNRPKCHPNLFVDVVLLGKSVEGRDIWLLEVGDGGKGRRRRKRRRVEEEKVEGDVIVRAKEERGNVEKVGDEPMGKHRGRLDEEQLRENWVARRKQVAVDGRKKRWTSSPEKKTQKGAEKEENVRARQKAMFLMGGLHAREWLSPAVVIAIADKVLREVREKG